MKRASTKKISKSRLFIDESFQDLKQHKKIRTKIMEKIQRGIQLNQSGVLQFKSAGEEMKLYSEMLLKSEETSYLGEWYQKFSVLIKKLSDLQTNLYNSITNNLVSSLQQFINKDLADARANKKKFERTYSIYNESKLKLDLAKKREKNAAKVTEAEAEYTQQQMAKDSHKSNLIKQLKDITELFYFTNLDNLWEAIDSLNVFFKEGHSTLKKTASGIMKAKEKLSSHKEQREAILKDKLENLKEKFSLTKSGRSDSTDSNPLALPSLSPASSPSSEPFLLSLDLSNRSSDESSSQSVASPALSPNNNLDKNNILSPRRRRHNKTPKTDRVEKAATSSSINTQSISQNTTLSPKSQEVNFTKNTNMGESDPSRALLLRFIYTETKYYDALTVLVKNYYEPFKLEFKDKHQERDMLFSNILDIYHHQTTVLEELNKCKDEWPQHSLAQTVLKNIAGIRVYKPYIINHETSLQSIEKLTKLKPWSTFLNNCANESGIGFLNLLEYPTMAVTTFKLQLDLVKRNNQCTAEELEQMEGAFTLINKVSEEIEVKKLYKVNMSKIILLQDQLINYDGRLDEKADRSIVYEGAVILTTETSNSEVENDLSKSKYCVFLCNDIVLICRKSKKRENRVRDKKYKVVHSFTFLDTTLTENIAADNELAFKIDVSGMSDEELITHTFFPQTKEEKAQWISAFNSQIELANSIKIFAVDIEVASKREKRFIPSVIDVSVKHIIADGGLETEGLIRVSGNARLIKSMRRAIDLGGRLNVDNMDVHTVCGLLKLYLRCLPEPIMGQCFDRLVVVYENNSLELDDKLLEYKKILEDLPEVNKYSLQIIFSFFDLLASRSSVNKMHSRNIAIVMGPILLNKQVNISWDLTNQNYSIEIVDELIQHFPIVFADIKQVARSNSIDDDYKMLGELKCSNNAD